MKSEIHIKEKKKPTLKTPVLIPFAITHILKYSHEIMLSASLWILLLCHWNVFLVNVFIKWKHSQVLHF